MTAPAPAPAPKKDRTVVWILRCAGCLVIVCVLAILASIAIPAFINYVKRSKTAEAHTNITQLASRLEASCDPVRGYAIQTAGPLPAVPGSNKQSANWSADPGFSAIGFDPGGPTYYRYEITSNGENRTVRVQGDLDDDGTLSTYEIQCYGGCRCDSQPLVTHELE
ncbi:MAG: hypothetical protein AAGE52_11005 [Myxococcota bacterium]